MDTIVLVFMMAITVEALVEYGKTFGKAIVSKDWKTSITQGVALLISVALCFAVNADMYGILGVEFAFSWIGVLLTGIFASRGANFVSDLFKKLQTAQTNKTKIE